MDDSWDNEKTLFENFFISKEERQERIDICKSCEYLNKALMCEKCNCVMPLKTWIIGSSCPEGKWQAKI